MNNHLKFVKKIQILSIVINIVANAKMIIRSNILQREQLIKIVGKNRRGGFIPQKILLEVYDYCEEFRTKFTIWRSKDIIGGIEWKKRLEEFDTESIVIKTVLLA